MSNLMRNLAAAIALCVGVSFALPASAVPTLRLVAKDSSGVVNGMLDIEDGSALDSDYLLTGSSTDGLVHYSGGLGNFQVSLATGITRPVIGSAPQPEMHLTSLELTMGTGGSVTIMFSEVGYDAGALGSDYFNSGIGGSSPSGSVDFATYADDSNTLFGTDPSALLAEANGLTGTGFSYTDLSAIELEGSYSLTTMVTVTHSGSTPMVTSIDAALQIPEPQTMLPLVIGTLLIGAGVARRRMAKA